MVGLAGIAAGSSTDLQAILPETEGGLHGGLNGASARVRSIDTGPELKRLKVESTVSSEATAPSRFESEGLEGFTDASQINGRHADDEEEEEEEDVHAVSPSSMKLERPRTSEQTAEDMKKIHGMWEMAAIIDFLSLFRPQLKLSREFGADELEHVLVAGTGDGGLLADLHADLLRGISPKSVIDTKNWVVHLANKIKFHWKGAPGGPSCPFRPEKYYEAVTYASLPVEQRVRALHFVCCVRLDREDCAARVDDSLRPLTRKELAEIEAAKEAAKSARPTRGSKAAAAAYRPPKDVDSFRKQPVGVESSGGAYYYLEGEMGCNRLYRESGDDGYEKQEDRIGDKTVGSDESSSDDDAEKSDEEEPVVDRKKPSGFEKEAAVSSSSPRITRSGLSGRQREKPKPRRPAVSRSRRRAALLTYELPPEPAPRKWELVASTLAELEEIGERLRHSTADADKALSNAILEELVPVVSERQAAEAKRLRAAERVARRLGGESASSFALDGRSRRERKPVNYAFTEFDDVMRSAIRRTQRGAEEEMGMGTYGGRHTSSPEISGDPVAEARAGLRRGRSAAHGGGDASSAITDQVPDISERAIRLARKAEAERAAAEEAARIAREEEEARRIQEEEEARQRELERLAAEEEERARQVEEAMRRAREARRLAMEMSHQRSLAGDQHHQGSGRSRNILDSGVQHAAGADRQSMPWQPFGSGLQSGGWVGTPTTAESASWPSSRSGVAPQFQLPEESYRPLLGLDPQQMPYHSQDSRRRRTPAATIGFRPPPPAQRQQEQPWAVPHGTAPPQATPQQLSGLNIAALNELLLQRQRQQHSSSAQGQLHGRQWG